MHSPLKSLVDTEPDSLLQQHKRKNRCNIPGSDKEDENDENLNRDV
ncbi:hypothetical protein BH10CYA1_BH10CYA1_18160 [soil metagenome]